MEFHRGRVLYLSFLVSFFLSAWASAQSGAPFPGFPWGTPYPRIQHARALSRTELDERAEQFKVPVQRLGSAELEDCEFEFNNGLFSGIIIMTRGRENTRALLRYLEDRFGKGAESEPRYWQWLKSDEYISLDEDSAGDGYVLWYGVAWQERGKNGK